MIDLRPTIIAKSDQLNADDLIAGPMTLTITDVRLLDAADQPVAVHWEGGEGRPFKPCKSMRRVMAKVWGEDGKAFIGQRMTVYRDERVRFGADAVGGIRISHMSGIDREVTMALMVTRGKRAPYSVKPLAAERDDRKPTVDLRPILADGRKAAAGGAASLTEWWGRLSRDEKAAAKPTLDSELKAAAAKADEAALNDFDAAIPSETTPEEPASDGSGRPISDAGDTFTSEEVETAADAEPNPTAELIAYADTLISRLPFASLADLKTMEASAAYRGKVKALKDQAPDKAAEVETAMRQALDAFG